MKVRQLDSTDPVQSLVLTPETEEEATLVLGLRSGDTSHHDVVLSGHVGLVSGRTTPYLLIRPQRSIPDINRLDTTVGEIIALAEQSNAAVTQIIHSGAPGCSPTAVDTPFQAIILVRGTTETAELLSAIAVVQSRWESGR